MTCRSHAFVYYGEQSMTKCSITWTHSTPDNRVLQRRTHAGNRPPCEPPAAFLVLFLHEKSARTIDASSLPFRRMRVLPPGHRSLSFLSLSLSPSFSLGGCRFGGWNTTARMYRHTRTHARNVTRTIAHRGNHNGKRRSELEGWQARGRRRRRRRRWRWRRRRRRRRQRRCRRSEQCIGFISRKRGRGTIICALYGQCSASSTANR